MKRLKRNNQFLCSSIPRLVAVKAKVILRNMSVVGWQNMICADFLTLQDSNFEICSAV